MPDNPDNTKQIKAARRQGAIDAAKAPVYVLFASMIGYGSLSRESGQDFWVTIGSTIGIWGLPGQLVMTEMLASGAPLLAIAIGVGVANARFLPMTLALTPYLNGWKTTWPRRFLFGQFVTLTPWVAALQKFPTMPMEERVPYYTGYSIVCLVGATVGTGLGHSLAGVLPEPLRLSLVFLSPAFFAMVFANVRHRAGVLALIFGALMEPWLIGLSPNWGLPATGVIAGSIAFAIDLLFRLREKGRDHV